MALTPAIYTMLLLCDPASEPETFVGPLPAEAIDDEDPLAMPRDHAFESGPASEPEPERTWDGGMYFTAGLAPMSTLTTEGFHPGLRFDVETGMAWQRGRAKVLFGPDIHVLQYFGRKKPGFGVDAMATLSLKHVYARVGAGTAMRIPTRRDIHDTRPMMGGLVGGGLVGRIDEVEGRLGVDYDVRIDTTGRIAQTVLVTMRVSFGP
ncbi:MAG: hypothetical protein AAGF11_47100 [Myxococcota bacterium]